MNKKVSIYVNWIIAIVLALALISLFIGMFSMVELLTSFRIVFGSVYVLFLPGFILSYVFFKKTHKHGSKKKGSIDWIERIALSFGLSIAIVPLVVFYLNLIGVSINLLNSFLTILGIILISVAILVYKNKKKK
jgi:LPXTG-motif cell wall-anchored protein